MQGVIEMSIFDKDGRSDPLTCANKQIEVLQEKLAKADDHVEKLESELLMLTLATGRESTWALGEKLLNKFAIEQQKKAIKDYISTLDRNLPEKVYLSYLAKDALLYCDNLDKEQRRGIEDFEMAKSMGLKVWELYE
jgi:hypothetical protein